VHIVRVPNTHLVRAHVVLEQLVGVHRLQFAVPSSTLASEARPVMSELFDLAC